MYKIEKQLLDNHFKKVREYDSGVVVYSNEEGEYEYTVEVALFTDKCSRHQRVWEITVFNPYGVTLGSYREFDKEAILDNHRVFSDDHVDYSFNFYNWLKEIEDPWSTV